MDSRLSGQYSRQKMRHGGIGICQIVVAFAKGAALTLSSDCCEIHEAFDHVQLALRMSKRKTGVLVFKPPNIASEATVLRENNFLW